MQIYICNSCTIALCVYSASMYSVHSKSIPGFHFQVLLHLDISFLKLFLNAPVTFHVSSGYTTPVSVASGNGTSTGSPLGTRTSSPPEVNQSATPQQPQSNAGTGQNPMAALMSVADTLPPGSPRSTGGSPPTSVVPRSASRGSQHSPNSTQTGKLGSYVKENLFTVIFWYN